MTAGEDQAQPIVVHGALLDRLVAGVEQRRLRVAIAARRLAAQPIDRAVARGGDDPAGGAGRKPACRPVLQGRGKRVLDGVLRDVDVAEHAHQHRHRAAVFLGEDTLDLR